MASVSFEHVDKVYGDGTRAIVDLDLRVEDGELLVLVGPSGCGKSTLLRLVAGLEQPTRGALRIGERVANQLTPRERNVAMVFQDYALYPHKTVRGNLEFPLRMRGLARAELRRRVSWAADLLDIGALLGRLPRQLSGGERQRVAMGRALVREPSVFLLDEPLSNLDAKLRVEVRAEIAGLQRRMRTTMLYVTHDQTEAMTLGDRVAVLLEGRLLQVAPPRELYDRPADVFVAGFIGSPPMNLLPARLGRGAGDGVVVLVAGQSLPLAEPLAGRARAAGVEAATAGIRPEALRLAPPGGGEDAIRGSIEHVEWLGHETLAYVRLDGAGAAEGAGGAPRLVARLPGMEPLRRGAGVALRVQPGAIHVFGADGRAIDATGGPSPGCPQAGGA